MLVINRLNKKRLSTIVDKYLKLCHSNHDMVSVIERCMMKVIKLLCLALFVLAANIAKAEPARAFSLTFDSSSYTHLTDTNQSQSFEAVSPADRPGGLPAVKLAAVHFIAGSNRQSFDTPNNDFSDPSGENCKRLGFNVSSCPSGLFNKACPYNDKIYDRCCDTSYKYSAANCPAPRILSSDTCGGKHSCLCSASSYPYTSCSSPQIKGASCSDDNGTRYASCSCPASASAPYGCQQYYASPCGSVCQTAYADNCRNRNAAQTPYGCVTYWSDCSSKCQTAYSDNCRNRNGVSAPYGCRQSYGDCQSKCEIAYSDNCHNRAAVSVPANASCSAHYSDCSAKCSAWNCNSGYKQSGSGCVIAAKCSDGGYLTSQGNNTCTRVSYQGLTCYSNCKDTITVTTDFQGQFSSCGAGPWVGIAYKEPGNSIYNVSFPRGDCVGSNRHSTTSRMAALNGELRLNLPSVYAGGKNYRFCTIHSAADFKCTRYNGGDNAECFVNVKEDESDHVYNIVYVETSQSGSCPSF